MTTEQLAAALREAIPDGTYGHAEQCTRVTTDTPRWTPAEQAQHRVELCAAFDITDDYRPTQKRSQ